MNMDFVVAQSDSLEPIGFQKDIISNLALALLSRPSPPILLRSPTGSGKTFMLVRSLSKVSAEQDTVWLWFVPYVNLVQTEDAILANSDGQLFPVMLSRGRNQEPTRGMVLLSTAAGVASAKDRKTGYSSGSDDDQRALNEFVELARARKLKIGLVVDEAHIGLKTGTEFGAFALWVKPDYMVMASATPKDAVLDQFLAQAGKQARTSFVVSRAQAVEARLNKKYIEAVKYDLQRTISTVADLKRTVLRQAWKKHLWLKKTLKAAEIDLTPLLLVQVANGDNTVEEARDDLIRLCRVSAGAIGVHSADEPDPVLMAAIANDHSKEVLIFKQSAGTGFDAPRAFVLASTKLVNDADFAMQFIGRVMRVASQVRDAFPKPREIPDALDTAFIYLADGEAQAGFQSAVNTVGSVKSQLEGQTEQMTVKHTKSGATVITNKISPQLPAFYDKTKPTPVVPIEDPDDEESDLPSIGTKQPSLFGRDAMTDASTTIMGTDWVVETTPKLAGVPADEREVLGRLRDQGLKAYRLNLKLPGVPAMFQQESRPAMSDMAKVSVHVATHLPLTEDKVAFAVRAAYNLLRDKEIHTELTKDEDNIRTEEVTVITDRTSLARDAATHLKKIPQVEESDVRIIIGTLAARLKEDVAVPPSDATSSVLDDKQLNRLARDAACWVVRRDAQRIGEMVQDAIAEFATVGDASPLPHFLLYPLSKALDQAQKNLYGIVPPLDSTIASNRDSLDIEGQTTMFKETLAHAGGTISVFGIDGSAGVNHEEREFIQSMERDDHVVWWHRNPSRKPWSVRIVRSEHRNYFYPDFVVCLEFPQGVDPEIRMVETKESTKDASRKAQRTPKIYGKVLFVTRDDTRLRIVNDDGSLGGEFDWVDLAPAWQWMAANRNS
ncbi:MULTISPECIES: DEAD/DEAH box helicase family protein [unclassified Lysobacter]|uniref:DEAD/DEAH box helicase family protein n=1 Tax=unclassified Lysobacter TaxID=2635362 RepID=UPI001BED14FA|nr:MULTISPECIES: DEAD/DEAH box helicase family protein [unclassified Lysobacter]MBT2748277.1 DEAD/DEAH box helicase family protein [Lysobacter sp. ISL-42]MBT2749956.1 DEAD/DEAH box helicase family protein [Lysobacter sp. ISL-50]MBT2781284.1 DEAD/DEAH box helicase family protein [Lysobacter sp. ISL-52]